MKKKENVFFKQEKYAVFFYYTELKPIFLQCIIQHSNISKKINTEFENSIFYVKSWANCILIELFSF